MPSHEHHRIAPTRSTEEGNSADAVNKGAGFMMPDLNGMEFAVREGGKFSLSLFLWKAFIPLLLLLVRPPFVLAKSLPRQIVHCAHSDNKK